MKNRERKEGGVYTYLNTLGLLSNGTPEEITAAKAAYWKTVRTNWQRNKRTANKKFEVFFTTAEYQVIARAAKLVGYSKVSYVKFGSLSYANKKYLVPRLEIIYEVRELLALTYSYLQDLVEERNVPVDIGDILLTKLEKLENKVVELLFNPIEVK
ncbi:MAG: hypothetical protein JST10_14960 [Bacteroidetes bacterium]|nr:hypothetical protein [Bacteroidota bacterium]